MNATTTKGLETMATDLEQLFGDLETITTIQANRLATILDTASKETLELLAARKIRFVSQVARLRLLRDFDAE